MVSMFMFYGLVVILWDFILVYHVLFWMKLISAVLFLGLMPIQLRLYPPAFASKIIQHKRDFLKDKPMFPDEAWFPIINDVWCLIHLYFYGFAFMGALLANNSWYISLTRARSLQRTTCFKNWWRWRPGIRGMMRKFGPFTVTSEGQSTCVCRWGTGLCFSLLQANHKFVGWRKFNIENSMQSDSKLWWHFPCFLARDSWPKRW